MNRFVCMIGGVILVIIGLKNWLASLVGELYRGCTNVSVVCTSGVCLSNFGICCFMYLFCNVLGLVNLDRFLLFWGFGMLFFGFPNLENTLILSSSLSLSLYFPRLFVVSILSNSSFLFFSSLKAWGGVNFTPDNFLAY